MCMLPQCTCADYIKYRHVFEISDDYRHVGHFIKTFLSYIYVQGKKVGTLLKKLFCETTKKSRAL